MLRSQNNCFLIPKFISDTPAWEAYLPDLKIRLDIVRLFGSGSRLLRIPELPGSLKFEKKKASLRDAVKGVKCLPVVSESLKSLA